MICVVALLFVIAMCDLMLPRLMASLINEGISRSDNDYILRTGLIMLLISLLSVSCSIVSNYLTALSAMGFGRKLRSDAFRKVTYFSLQQTGEFGTASLITRTSSDVRELQGLLQGGLTAIVSVPLHMVGGIVMALSMNTRLALIIIFAMPLVLLLIYININWVRPLFETMRDKLDSVSRVLREILLGIRVIRAFNAVEKEHERFNAANHEYTETFKKARYRMALLNPASTIITSGMMILVYWFGQFRIDAGDMTAGDIMAFTQYITQILGSIMALQMIFNMIPGALIASKRLNQMLDTEPQIVDPDEPLSPPREVFGEVRFENVTFRYPGAERPVLENISFEAKPGESVAIIGGTGSGKTTLVSLIPRLYDIQQGRIFVDHIDVTKMAQNDLRERIGFVTQRAQLFTGSVANNIRFGNVYATDEDIVLAAEIAQASEFIDEMSDKYDSFISQDASNLSGGQKQRISIARAIARNPEIYIFDDSFSAVDFKTEAALRTALKTVTEKSTVIIVAQRVSTVLNADRIIVLDEGKCVGQGTHETLMDTCEIYREIVYSQLGEEEV